MSFIATTDMYIEMRNKRDLVEDKLHDMTKQRNSLIDDIAVLKANISRLEKIRNIKDSSLKGADIKIKTLERENGELRKTLIKTQNLADELMEYQVKYINLTNHIRLKA
ncbi:hypothetical protein, partial [Staphylococcus xylosus]|uniref:hypothetical protein n=1 Tax=Staphylococcus xylosus TaxID=1288 RepID=UPI000D3F7F27